MNESILTSNIIKIKDIIDEDFINYKKISMFIATNTCTFKCEKEDPNVKCHNCDLVKQDTIEMDINKLINRYLKNKLSKSIVFGGLEPLDNLLEILKFILVFRKYYKCNDDIIIFTGYTEEEVKNMKFLSYLKDLKLLDNNLLIIKYGRFKTNLNSRYDSILGIDLASSNQYSKAYQNGSEIKWT